MTARRVSAGAVGAVGRRTEQSRLRRAADTLVDVADDMLTAVTR